MKTSSDILTERLNYRLSVYSCSCLNVMDYEYSDLKPLAEAEKRVLEAGLDFVKSSSDKKDKVSALYDSIEALIKLREENGIDA